MEMQAEAVIPAQWARGPKMLLTAEEKNFWHDHLIHCCFAGTEFPSNKKHAAVTLITFIHTTSVHITVRFNRLWGECNGKYEQLL